jgi:hypothetical protein
MRWVFFKLKYEKPFLFKIINLLIIVCILLFFFTSLPNTNFTRALGVVSGQERFFALRNAVYWKSRELLNRKLENRFSIIYGFIVRVDRNGLATFNIPTDDSFVEKNFLLADLKVKNVDGINNFFKNEVRRNVKLEIVGEAVIIYKDGVPLNLKFIENGFAIPDPNPPSNIVDGAFARYYWNLASNID